MRILGLTSKINNIYRITSNQIKILNSLDIYTYSDLICYKPRKIIDRTQFIGLKKCKSNIIINKESSIFNTTIKVINTTFFGKFNKQVFKATVIDIYDNTALEILCFGRNFYSKILQKNTVHYIYGTAIINNMSLQTSTFEIKRINKNTVDKCYKTIDVIYPLNTKISSKSVNNLIKYILNNIDVFYNELPTFITRDLNIYTSDKAIRELHMPSSIQSFNKALYSLKTIELFYFVLSTVRQKRIKNLKSQNFSKLENKLINSLPFKLTNDQLICLHEIDTELENTSINMNRLLQGDVGSGKTLIAILSSLKMIEKKYQVALMAPTEILAYQHAQNTANILKDLNVNVAYLSGSINKKKREILLEKLANGEIDMLIGTHALFSKDVKFKNLKYIIIDEQHRFGVEQRKKLIDKGKKAHVLNMSATPIPRTLILSMYGNVTTSTINQMPLNRKPIITYLVSEESRDRMYKTIKVELKRKHQVYFVYPKIDEDENSNLRDVNTMYEKLKSLYPEYKSAIIHGKLSDEEKTKILDDFAQHKIDYIVATSVVEVGIDIKNATVMVVEHAERFGLAQLHQIRGRVGRSSLQSYCFLVYSPTINEEGKARMKIMRKSNDGFFISEQDLRLRGPGDIKGIKQSGYVPFRFASIANDIDLLEKVNKYVCSLLEKDPYLTNEKLNCIRYELKNCRWFNYNNLTNN